MEISTIAMPPQFWLNLQTAYDLSRAELAVGKAIVRDVHPRAA
jgi:plasmid maintenance system antidote protein VapI